MMMMMMIAAMKRFVNFFLVFALLSLSLRISRYEEDTPPFDDSLSVIDIAGQVPMH